MGWRGYRTPPPPHRTAMPRILRALWGGGGDPIPEVTRLRSNKDGANAHTDRPSYCNAGTHDEGAVSARAPHRRADWNNGVQIARAVGRPNCDRVGPLSWRSNSRSGVASKLRIVFGCRVGARIARSGVACELRVGVRIARSGRTSELRCVLDCAVGGRIARSGVVRIPIASRHLDSERRSLWELRPDCRRIFPWLASLDLSPSLPI